MRITVGVSHAVLGLCLAVSVAIAGSHVPEISPVRTLGLDEELLYLNRPIDVSWAPDGRAFILNGGDNTVAVMSDDWSYLKAFAGKGEAPGELSMPAMLHVTHDQVWVKVPRGVETYDLEGRYEGLNRLPYEISSVFPQDGELICTSSLSGGIGVRVDAKGEILGFFGPPPPSLKDTRDFARSLSWLWLPGDPNSCTLLDLFDGEARVVRDLKGEGQLIDLDLGRGKFFSDFQYKAVISDACLDPEGGFFVIHYPEAGGPGYLFHFDQTWKQDGRWAFADSMRPGIIRVSPQGEICLIEEKGSIIHLCARPR